jgi:hypothetical protein
MRTRLLMLALVSSLIASSQVLAAGAASAVPASALKGPQICTMAAPLLAPVAVPDFGPTALLIGSFCGSCGSPLCTDLLAGAICTRNGNAGVCTLGGGECDDGGLRCACNTGGGD